jgi:hypothetical protein
MGIFRIWNRVPRSGRVAFEWQLPMVPVAGQAWGRSARRAVPETGRGSRLVLAGLSWLGRGASWCLRRICVLGAWTGRSVAPVWSGDDDCCPGMLGLIRFGGQVSCVLIMPPGGRRCGGLTRIRQG